MAWESAETIRAAAGIEVVVVLRSTKARIIEGHMVEQVSEDDLRFQVDLLSDVCALLEADVYIPVAKTTEKAPATIPGIESQDRLPESVVRGGGIGEKARQAPGYAVDRAMDRRDLNSVLRFAICEEVLGIALTESLTTTVDRPCNHRDA